jgi:hypothetical protein
LNDCNLPRDECLESNFGLRLDGTG